MLLSSFQITHILPCLADPEKIRTIAQLSMTLVKFFHILTPP